jgi:hypothetical protein
MDIDFTYDMHGSGCREQATQRSSSFQDLFTFCLLTSSAFGDKRCMHERALLGKRKAPDFLGCCARIGSLHLLLWE